ncbi:MAG TPA: sulfite oxidase [Verrucomicrobiae bacterium]|jgi:DMSO/TMAO reductase YedYZ molybdopterin-dependent catalytic subunit
MNTTALSEAPAATAHHSFAGLILRDKEPENLEFPFATLRSFVTANEQFFVRSHFAVPKIEAYTWRLKIEGLVERPCELSLDELLGLKTRTVAATIECAGNNRIFLSPKVDGLQWELGAVGNAEWTGVPLATVLERVGVQPGAVEVVFEGTDSGKLAKPPSPGNIHYAHSIPLTKAFTSDVLLVHTMNGEPLTPSHGFPLRVVVPGWYGMASVKWLQRIVLVDRPFRGYFKSADYTYWEARQGLPTQLLPVTENEVKAQIARPAPREIVAADSIYRVHGAAWAGEANVTQVQVSADGGTTWDAANLLGDPVPYAWRFWEYHWRTPAKPGRCTVMARAMDSRGRVQPMQRDPHRGSYVISHVVPIEVEVSDKVRGGGPEPFAI